MMNFHFSSISNECSIYRKRSVNAYLRRVYLEYNYGLDLSQLDVELVLGFKTGYEYGYILGVM